MKKCFDIEKRVGEAHAPLPSGLLVLLGCCFFLRFDSLVLSRSEAVWYVTGVWYEYDSHIVSK